MLPDEDIGDGNLLLWHAGDLMTDKVLLPGEDLDLYAAGKLKV